MSAFAVGEWVRHNGSRGIVREVRSRKVLVRWLDRVKAEAWDPNNLTRSSPPRALVLEGSLGDTLHSTRSAEGTLRTWLKANEIPLAYKNIHTLDDISVIGKAVGRSKPAFVHLSCHGNHEQGRPYFTLAPRASESDRIYLDDERTAEVFGKHFRGLPLLFSACFLGKYQDSLISFRDAAGLAAVASYTRDISDAEALLFELLLYHGVLVKGMRFGTAIERANYALLELSVKGSRGHGQQFARVF